MKTKIRHPEKVNKPVNPIKKKPDWIRSKLSNSKEFFLTKTIVNQNNLVTVCQEANCPNITECWSKRHATFMIMGDTCTRACAFCDVKTGKPEKLDPFEPYKISNAVSKLDLKHVVITSVDRDDLNDGGSNHFYEVINATRKKNPKAQVKAHISSPPDEKVKDEAEPEQRDQKVKVPSINGTTASVKSLSINDWLKDFEKLGLNGISYQLFSELEFKETIGNKLILMKPKNFSSPTFALIDEFINRCKEYFKVSLEVVIEEGNVTNSPSLVKEKIANQNAQSTIEELENEPIISEILESFDGTIEPDSISTKE